MISGSFMFIFLELLVYLFSHFFSFKKFLENKLVRSVLCLRKCSLNIVLFIYILFTKNNIQFTILYKNSQIPNINNASEMFYTSS